jgi:hypothetical protein
MPYYAHAVTYPLTETQGEEEKRERKKRKHYEQEATL